MDLQSMTGFARIEAGDESANWTWEMRSVNGKSLDLRFRMPNGLEGLEPGLREFASTHLKRGNIQISLNMERSAGAAVPRLNQPAFDAALQTVRLAAERSGLPMPALDSVLAMKGVIELVEPTESEEQEARRNKEIIKSFENAVLSLKQAREAEGASMGAVLIEQVARIEALTELVKHDKSRTAEAIRERLANQLSQLVDQSGMIDSQRLNQEAAILATKSDLQEEIDRLETHITSARTLINSGEPIGRKLDFLSQEFNRECNTICSKSNASSVTTPGLEMKVVIDQFREQVQNIQ